VVWRARDALAWVLATGDRAVTLAWSTIPTDCRCRPDGRHGYRAGSASEADPPGALTNLQLTQSGRGEPGDERRQELLAQALDGGMIGGPLGR